MIRNISCLYLTLLISFSALAKDQHAKDIEDIIRSSVRKIESQKELKSFWLELQKMKDALKEFEEKNDSEISVDTRIDLSMFTKQYLKNLPTENEFKKSDCNYYLTRLKEMARVESASEFDFYPLHVEKLIDAVCNLQK